MKECSQVEESRKFTIMGGDGSTYGTITGGEVLKWIEEGRLNWNDVAKEESTLNWKKLIDFAGGVKPPL